MSKCGKGCMPECEYFTTGGCASPFNCSYKIEEISPMSATSISDAFVQGLIAENAALREQISKMIMPPCTLGDTLHLISFYFGDGYDEAGNAVHRIDWQITETKVDEKNFYRMCDLVRNKKAFFSREAAVARLAELKGEEKNG